MKLLRITITCAALGLAAWAPAPAMALPTAGTQATVQLAQYVPYRHRRFYRHRYYHRHRRPY